MKNPTSQSSGASQARLAGWLYLLVIPLGIFGGLYVPSQVTVSGDAAATAANLTTSASLYRLGIASELLASIDMLFVVLLLYGLLKVVSKPAAASMVMLVLVGASIAFISAVFELEALKVLGSTSGFPADQARSQMSLMLSLSGLAGMLAFIFWGLWLIPLGYLVFKSGFFPRVLGVLLVLAGVGYAFDSFATVLGSDLSIGLYTALGEIIFVLWLVIRGVDAVRWEERARAAA